MDSHGRRSGSPALVVDAGRDLVSHLSARSCFTKEARIGKLERSTDSIIGTTFHLGAYISRQSTPSPVGCHLPPQFLVQSSDKHCQSAVQ